MNEIRCFPVSHPRSRVSNSNSAFSSDLQELSEADEAVGLDAFLNLVREMLM